MRERIGEQREREEEASEFQSEACKGKKERDGLGLLGLACQNDLVLGWAKRSKTV